VDGIQQDAWRICNDALRTDACLLYPPHMIAIAAIALAVINHGREKDFKGWLAELAVDFERIHEIHQTIFALYRVWDGFKEKEQLFQLTEKLPKPVERRL